MAPYDYFKTDGISFKRSRESVFGYFRVDTGLLSALLGITSEQALLIHSSRGSFFETLMITEFLKYAFHTRKQFEGYFWRDREGHEVDLIINLSVPIAIEIKASTTLHSDDFKQLHYFGTRSDTPVTHRYVILRFSHKLLPSFTGKLFFLTLL